jgi:hypothetical protein
MRLDDARLCLDCEEVHEEQECPACGSEAFGFLTRWIQSTTPARPSSRGVERRTSSPAERPAVGRAEGPALREPDQEQLAAWRQIVSGEPAATPGRGRKIVTRSLLGLAAAGLAGWVWTRSADKDEGEG